MICCSSIWLANCFLTPLGIGYVVFDYLGIWYLSLWCFGIQVFGHLGICTSLEYCCSSICLLVIVLQHMAPLGIWLCLCSTYIFSAPFVLHPREMLFLGVVIVFPTHGTLGYPDPLTSQANTLFVASPSILTHS